MERRWSTITDMNEGNIVLFLESFDITGKRLQNKQQKSKTEIENITIAENAGKYSITDRLNNFNRNELESLFVEALYTIKHKIGKTIDGHSDYINDLYTYVQEAFKFSPTDLEQLLLKINDENPPILFLNVEVVEASNLEAKDANGFSDPYCMLGIIANRKSIIAEDVSGGSDDEVPKMPPQMSRRSSKVEIPKPGFIRRLSTLRKSDKSRYKASTRHGAIRDGKLPAKYIQTTDVKKATLNPVWMEKFRFKIDDINTEKLHLDIWDHDDEFSVVEAARKLNEVKSFKGLDRYFKQIAQSARTDKSEKDSHVDDYLGSVNISLCDMPSNGIDRWYDLEGRTEKSKVEGKIRLKLSLATREDRGDMLTDECNYSELTEHEKLMSIFIDFELAKFKGKNDEWKGDLCKEAATILHQHAIQGDITEIQIETCRWITYSKKHVEKQLSYRLLLQILDKLDSIWKPTSSSRDELDSLRESFTFTINNCFKSILKLRELFPVSNKNSLEKLEYMLRLIDKIYKSEVFKYCCPFQNSVTHEVSQIIKSFTLDSFEQSSKQFLSNKNEDDQIKKLIDFCQAIILDSYISIKYYNPIFEKTLNLQYFNIAYKKIDQKLYDLLFKILYEEFGDDLKLSSPFNSSNKDIDQITDGLSNQYLSINNHNENMTSPNRKFFFYNYGLLTDQTALSLFELYVSLNEFSRFSFYINKNDRVNLKITKFYELFFVAVARWIELISHKIDLRIEKFPETDKDDFTLENTQFMASTIEITSWFSKITQFWQLIGWPEQFGSLFFVTNLFDEVSTICLKYCTYLFDLVRVQQQQLSQMNETDEKIINTHKQNLLRKFCKVSNSIERIKESLKLFQHELENVKSPKGNKFEESNLVKIDSKQFLNIIQTTNVYIEQIIQWMIKNHIETEIESHLFYFSESPESSPAQESISRLIQYLDSNLVNFRDQMVKSVFEYLLKVLWLQLLQLIKTVSIKDYRSTIFFIKMNDSIDILIDFLHADNQGLSKDVLKNTESYKELKNFLKYAQIDTSKLILMYYQEMISTQNSLKTNEYGKIYCRAFYHSKHETLCVEVMKCKNLQPMDQNGLSDPYVEVELKPSYLFPMCEKKTTAIVKKSLNPNFDETFEFKVPEKLCRIAGTTIHLTVMDHDLMWTNDFEGEAFIELSSIPGLNNDLGDGGFYDLKSTELGLIQPKSYRSIIWEILEMRTQDKLAIDFVKIRRTKLKT